MKGTKSVKKGIAALIIAAAMISTPGTLNAGVYFTNKQWLHVVSQESGVVFTGFNRVVYRYNGGTWTSTEGHQGEWWMDFDILNTWIDAYLYDDNAGHYTDEMFVSNLKRY